MWSEAGKHRWWKWGKETREQGRSKLGLNYEQGGANNKEARWVWREYQSGEQHRDTRTHKKTRPSGIGHGL